MPTREPNQQHGGLHRLLTELLSHYESLIIPRTPVNVTYGIDLISVDGVDEKEGILRISTITRIMWFDHRFQWNPSEYYGIKVVNLPASQVWHPDLRPHAQILEEEEVNLLVYYDGTIYHYPPIRLAVPCEMHFAYYPFDTQACSLKVESWSYDSAMINFTMDYSGTARLLDYRPNQQWKLLSFTADRNELRYVCCEETFASLTFNIMLQRQVREYTIRVLAPSVVTSLLILLCFLIPPHCGERILFVSILLLCILLQLVHLNLTVPIRGPDAPYLADFLCFSVFLAFFAVVESVLSLNLSRGVRGSSSNNSRGDGEEFGMQTKTNTGMTRIARFIDVGCFMVFTFIFAVAGGVILNP
ncbi:neuronal acetylcholine receptor subunit alpha-3-like isoform X2 [Acanthaster planci]|uniref:Neuronal acetylcholine receptor subunit alpha-3-like isoform X2 n=1 Tax=Acanthaster planci TaxID=133434 RepID=A0A8B7ZSX8_ACAPL|nr:neuronal acetylcholine receptor subunit alpha-3-like isoform X2 [Acanthaster planci]